MKFNKFLAVGATILTTSGMAYHASIAQHSVPDIPNVKSVEVVEKQGEKVDFESLLVSIMAEVEKDNKMHVEKTNEPAPILNNADQFPDVKKVPNVNLNLAKLKKLNTVVSAVATEKEVEDTVKVFEQSVKEFDEKGLKQIVHEQVLEKNKINVAYFPKDKELLDTLRWASDLAHKHLNFKDDRIAFAMLGSESSFGNKTGEDWRTIRGRKVKGEQAVGPMQVMPSYIRLVMSPANPYSKKMREMVYEASPEIKNGDDPVKTIEGEPKLQVLFGYIAIADLLGQKQVVNPPTGMSKIEAVSRTYNAGPNTNNWYGPENNAHASNSLIYYNALKNIDKVLSQYDSAYTVAYNKALEEYQTPMNATQLAELTVPDFARLDAIKDELAKNGGINSRKFAIK